MEVCMNTMQRGVYLLLMSLCAVVLVAVPCDAAATEIAVPSRSDGAILGQGYDNKKEQFVGKCLKLDTSKTLYTHAPSALIKFDRSLTSSELQTTLGFAAGGRAKYGVVSFSAAANFTRDAAASQYSETTTYSASYTFKNATLKDFELQTFAEETRGSDEKFRTTCGDEYVEQVRLGAVLLINMRLEFASIAEKQRFSAKFRVDGPAFGAFAEAEKASQEFRDSASVVISAFQLGGDVTRLSTVFGAMVGQQYAVMVCSMKNLAACSAVWNNALLYATDLARQESFPQQIKAAYDPTKIEGLAEIAYITKPWSTINITPKHPGYAPGVRVNRDSLEKQFDYYEAYARRVSALRIRPVRLSPAQVSLLDRYNEGLRLILKEHVEMAEICYTDDKGCVDGYNEFMKRVGRLQNEMNFDVSKLNIAPETFAQWCDYVGGDGSKPVLPALQASRNSVDALVAYARSVMVNGKDEQFWNGLGDKCQHVEGVLAQVVEIGVVDRPFGDLRPLSSLENVKALTLKRAGIEDLRGLSALKNLVRLDLSGNSISNASIGGLDQILELKQLQALSLRDNHLSDVKPLGTLDKLVWLDIGRNPLVDDSCPLKGVDAECVR
jgi:hypothetical protein